MGYIEHPWERAGVITPGLPILPHGTERHPVPGGGSRAVPVYKGDVLSVLDREGMQRGEMVFFAPDRSSDAGHLGAAGIGRPDGIITTLANGSRPGAAVLKALAKAGFDIGIGDAVSLFADGSQAGDRVEFTAQSDGMVILAAPGGPMEPQNHDAPTELILYIKRADPNMGKTHATPPDKIQERLRKIL